MSANYIVRSHDGEITQMVHDADAAWHAQCYNRRSIGIEHEGYVADPGTWYTEAMYSESAKLTRWAADRYGIAKNRTHIIGHYEVAPSCNTADHTDPGSGWNWTHYMDLVNSGVPTRHHRRVDRRHLHRRQLVQPRGGRDRHRRRADARAPTATASTRSPSRPARTR